MLNVYKKEAIDESFNEVFPYLLTDDNLSGNTVYVNNYCLSVKVVPTPFFTNIILEDRSNIEEISRNILDNNVNNVVKLLNSSADGLSIVDKNGVIIHANKTLLNILSIDSKKMIGKVSTSLVEKKLINDVTYHHVSKKKKNVDLKQILTHKNTRIFTTAVPVFSHKGEIEYIVSTSRDIHSIQQIYQKTSIVKPRQTFNKISDFIKTLREEDNVIESPGMIKAFRMVEKAKDTEAPVLLIGETGVGKEVFAKAIHEKGIRKDKPFMKVNCGAIPSELLESELFGYEDGAFTGAKRGGKKGLFELADGGTLFLDEITTLSLPLQAKLLRALQENEIMRVGGTKTIKLNTRIIAAANDLHEKIEKGEFRRDLYYRLDVVQIKIPPLRERSEDIPVLVEQYLNKMNKKYNKNISFSPEAMAFLKNYTWPGNVRELINVVEKCVILSDKNVLEPMDLPKEINPVMPEEEFKFDNLNKVLFETEKKLIEKAMFYFGSTRKAAKALGVSQPTIVRKLQQYSYSNPGQNNNSVPSSNK